VDFFNVLAIEVIDPTPLLGQYAPRLIPMLFSHLSYTASDLESLWDEIQPDANQPDRDEDIKPRLGMFGGVRGQDEDDDENEGESEMNSRVYTIRQSAGKCLENLSRKLPSQVILTQLIPCLERGLTSPAWVAREGKIDANFIIYAFQQSTHRAQTKKTTTGALMGLGAVAQGCDNSLEPHLPNLLPFIVAQASDEAVLLRKIALWTLGRFAPLVFLLVGEAKE